MSSFTSSKVGLFQARCEYSSLSSLIAAIRKFRGRDVFRERSLTTRSEERRFYWQVVDCFMYAQTPGFDRYSNHTQLFFHH